MTSMKENKWFDDAVTMLAEKSWCHLEAAFNKDAALALNAWIDQQFKLKRFRLSGLGQGNEHHNNREIRGDWTLWLEDCSDDDAPITFIKSCVETLRLQLNRELFAGLESFEGHFSVYPPGAFYKRHVDTFRRDDARAMTFILYLNPGWHEGCGGELLLEVGSEACFRIKPTLGTIVLFDSRQFPHEVLPAHVERRSFTGWFKVRSLISEVY